MEGGRRGGSVFISGSFFCCRQPKEEEEEEKGQAGFMARKMRREIHTHVSPLLSTPSYIFPSGSSSLE